MRAMFILLVTCLLTAGQVFVPPQGWDIVKVIGGGERYAFSVSDIPRCVWLNGTITCSEKPSNAGAVYLQRTIQEGATVEAPPGCTMTVTSLLKEEH